MDKRLLITFVVLAGLGFVYLASTNQGADKGGSTPTETSSEGVSEESLGTSGGATSLDAAALVADEGTISLRHTGDGEDFSIEVSPRGATLSSVRMFKEQYIQLDNEERSSPLPPELRGAIPERYYAAGPLELVSTWAASSYPFQLELDAFEYANKIRRVLRETQTNGEIDPAHPERLTALGGGDFVGGYPGVREGDLLEVVAPAELAAPGPRRVVRVMDNGTLELDPPFAVTTRQEHVSYRIVAEAAFEELFKRDRRFTLVAQDDSALTFVWPDPTRDQSEVFVERRIRIGGTYAIDLNIIIHNFGVEEVKSRLGLSVIGFQPPVEGGGMFSGGPPDQRTAMCRADEAIYRGTPAEMIVEPDAADWRPGGSVSWIGVESRYFLLAAVPSNRKSTQCAMSAFRTDPPLGVVTSRLSRTKTTTIRGTKETCVPDWMPPQPTRLHCSTMLARLGLEDPVNIDRVEQAYESRRVALEGQELEEAREARMALRGRRRAVQNYRIYAGPKDLDYLAAAAPEAGLDGAVDFWIVGFLAQPMIFFLKLFHGVIPHWGVAIILLTILVKLLLLPLTHKSFQSMQAMQKLKPDMEELKKKYGTDKQKLNQEMMALYKRHKVNPLGGCLPLLLQMPIYIALYRSIYASVELYQAPLFGWIGDLSAPDPYYVLPILLGASMFLQQKLAPTAVDSRQARMMMYFMPIMFTVFMLFLPSGLVLYIFVNTLLTMVQQLMIKKKSEAPQTPAASAKAG